MYELHYHRPATLAEAANLPVQTKRPLIAGGHTLIPTMKQRLAARGCDRPHPPRRPRRHRDEGPIAGDRRAATHAAVATSAIVGEAIPALADLAAQIGDPAVRHKGTIGGSLANNDPAADYPAAVLALGATIRTDKRRLTAEDFFQGLFATALDGE